MKSFFHTIKSDIVYIILLAAVMASYGTYFLSRPNSEDSSTATSQEQVSEQERKDAFNERLMMSQVSPVFLGVLIVMMGAAGCGVVLGIVFLLRGFPKRRYYPELSYIDDKSDLTETSGTSHPDRSYLWSLWGACKILIIFFSVHLALNILQGFIIGLRGLSHEQINTEYMMIVNMILSEVVSMFFLVRMVHLHNLHLSDFGLHRKHFLFHVVFGISSYCMFLPVFFILYFITVQISRMLGIQLEPQTILYLISDDSNFTSTQFKVIIMFVAVLGPFFEEVFFRGFLYRALKRHFGFWVGLIINAFIFSLIHWNIQVFLPIFGLGIVLALLVERTGSLIPSIIMHILVNSVSLTMLLSMSGD